MSFSTGSLHPKNQSLPLSLPCFSSSDSSCAHPHPFPQLATVIPSLILCRYTLRAQINPRRLWTSLFLFRAYVFDIFFNPKKRNKISVTNNPALPRKRITRNHFTNSNMENCFIKKANSVLHVLGYRKLQETGRWTILGDGNLTRDLVNRSK